MFFFKLGMAYLETTGGTSEDEGDEPDEGSKRERDQEHCSR